MGPGCLLEPGTMPAIACPDRDGSWVPPGARLTPASLGRYMEGPGCRPRPSLPACVGLGFVSSFFIIFFFFSIDVFFHRVWEVGAECGAGEPD